jgi:hypothetical protein
LSLLVHAEAVAWTIAGFVLLGISFFGWGRFTLKLLGTDAPAQSQGVTVLLGWAYSLLILQILNLVVAIRGSVAIPLFAAGLLMSVPALRAYTSRVHREPIPTSLVWITTCLIAVAAWVASKGMYRVESFDSGLYHLPTIRWLNTYPIVPGLGNLHFRMAFSQAFFAYAAALNAGWFAGHARSAANGFLFLVLLFQAAQGLWRNSHTAIQDHASCALTWAADLLVIPLLIYLALSSDGFSSPTPDLAATLLQLSMFLIFVRAVGEWKTKGEMPHFAATILPLLAATAITVKLSTIAFSASILVACVLLEAHPSYKEPQALRRAALRLAPSAAVIGVWLLRGLILSGCPLYPATIGCLRVDWAIPIDKVINEANWIYSWAREPGVDWRFVLGDWHWLRPWMARESRDFIGFGFPLAASFVLTISAVVLRRDTSSKTGGLARYSDFIILIPVVLGILFWFFTAPDARFGRALFWMLSMGGGLSLLGSLRPLLSRRSFRVAVLGLFVAVNAPFFAYVALRGASRVTRISTSGWQPIPAPRLVSRPTSSGLVVFVPESGEKCWDSPVPCTPYFNPNLALRVSGRLDRGFVDKPPLRGGAPTRSP